MFFPHGDHSRSVTAFHSQHSGALLIYRMPIILHNRSLPERLTTLSVLKTKFSLPPQKKYPTRQSTPPTPITSFLYFWLTSHFVRSNINLSKSCHFHTDERLLHFLITQLQKQPLPLLTPSFAESALLPACDTWTLHIKHCNGYGWVFRCFPVCKLMLYWPVLRERRHLAEHWYDCTNHLHMPASFCTLQGKCSDKWTVRPNPRRTANTAVKVVHYRWRTNQTMAALKVACHLRDGIIQD